MAAQIKEKLGIEPKLIASGGGVFEVVANNKLVFSKKAEDRFPEATEIFASLADLT